MVSFIKGRSGQISGYILIAEPIGLANRLEEDLRERKK